MYGSAHGGDDTLTGGVNSTNTLYGDGHFISDSARGGDDTLTGGDNSTNYLYGDAPEMHDTAQGGSDTLISSTSNDAMWGDAEVMVDHAQGGNDTFVLGVNNAHHTIHDFEQSKDAIDLSGRDFLSSAGQVPVEQLSPQAREAIKHAPSTETGWDALDSNGNNILDDGDKYVSVAGNRPAQ